MPGMIVESGLAGSTHHDELVAYPHYQLLRMTFRLYRCDFENAR